MNHRYSRKLLALSFVFAGSAHAAATYDCLIEPTQTIELRSTVGGRIEKITVRRGDKIQKGQVLVRTHRCALCASDAHFLCSGQHVVEMSKTYGGPYASVDLSKPIVMGHEYVGEIVDYGPGSRRPLKVGTRVTSAPIMRQGGQIGIIGYASGLPGGFGEYMLPQYAFFVSQMPYVRRQIETHATGSSGSMKNISQGAIRSLRVLLPSSSEQAKIVQLLNNADDRLKSESIEMEKLRLLKQGLTEDLLTGRMPVAPLLAESTP